MKTVFTPYEHGANAFLEVERFLARSVAAFETPRNWFIDRWNFTYAVSRVMHGATVADWAKAIGLWRDEDGRIVAMAHEEEQRGDVFFEFDRPDRVGERLLGEMFAFAERACVKERNGGTGFGLRIPQSDRLTAALAAERGYRKGDYSEPLSVRPIPYPSRDAESGEVPGDLRLIDGAAVAPDRKAVAHARAFGYADKPEQITASVSAFENLAEAPSYRKGLDLALENGDGEIVSFVGLWLDPVSRLGVLEPVGTVPEYRKRGLARLLIAEGERRLERLGAERLFVGSDQEFYKAVGFRVIARQDVWEYRAEGPRPPRNSGGR